MRETAGSCSFLESSGQSADRHLLLINFPPACADVRSFDDIARLKRQCGGTGGGAASVLSDPERARRRTRPARRALRRRGSQRDVHPSRRFQSPGDPLGARARQASRRKHRPPSRSTRWARPTRSSTRNRTRTPSATRFAPDGSRCGPNRCRRYAPRGCLPACCGVDSGETHTFERIIGGHERTGDRTSLLDLTLAASTRDRQMAKPEGQRVGRLTDGVASSR